MEDFRRRLPGCVQKLSLNFIMREVHVFSRLLYRSKNQHRRDKSFQMLNRVSKDLKRYHAAALQNQLKALVKLCSGSVTVKTEAGKLASRLTDCAEFIAKLIKFIEKSFSEVHQRLLMSWFIPFNLLMLASLSRMWFCLRYHLLAISETYDIVRRFLYEDAKLPLSITNHLRRPYQRYLTESVGRMQALVTSAEGGRTGRGRLGREEKNAVAASESIINDMGVPVALNEEQLAQRQQDLIHPSKLPFVQNNLATATATEKNKCSKLPKPEFSSQGGRVAIRFNTLIVLVKKGRKVLKLRARSRRLISRLSRDGTHMVAASHVRLGTRSPWGLVHWCSLQLHTTPFPPSKRFYLRRREKPKQQQQGLCRPDQVVQFATGHRSVQKLQEKFELEMEEAKGNGREGTISGVQNHQGSNKTAVQPTSCDANDEIEDIFRTLEDTH